MYRIEDFKNLKLFLEKPDPEECNLENGKVITNLPPKVRQMLNTVGGPSHHGDKSSQDASVINTMLKKHDPADVYKTFTESRRGKDAEIRKVGHFRDYVERTIKSQKGFSHKHLDGSYSNITIEIDFSNRPKKIIKPGLNVSMADTIEVEKVNWLWPGYIPSGTLTVLAGDPGMGKSTIVTDLITRISRGQKLPSGPRGITGTSLMASAEDSPKNTIVPRLVACGADLKRCGIIGEVREDAEDGQSKYLSLPRDIKMIKESILGHKARLFIIDPLSAFIDKEYNSYKDQDVRIILHQLQEVAEETSCAVLVICHLNKKEDSSTLYRIGGSIGFIAAARSVIAVTAAKDGTKVFYSLKSNLAKTPPALSYTTEEKQRIRTNGEWRGEGTVKSNTIRWIGEIDYDPINRTATSGLENEVTDFLRQALQDAGEVESDQLFREAKQAGINRTNLTRIKTELGIRNVKRNGSWYWVWPSQD